MRQQKRGKLSVSGEAFWRFSLAFYSRPGIADALVGLQDRAGLDVNLILFAVWRGIVHRHRLDERELTAAEAAVAPLRREVVGPLRELRRRLKGEGDPDLEALRPRIAALELAGERRAQSRLAATVESREVSSGDRRVVTLANLALCLGPEAHSPEGQVLDRALDDFLAIG
jgi:uncharacterized protein (TIGR02444 family)